MLKIELTLLISRNHGSNAYNCGDVWWVVKDVFNLLASLTRIQKVHDAPMSQNPHSFDVR